MLARPRTNVAQWHALKAWLHHPASSMAPSCLLFPSPPSLPPSSPPSPILMHKTDLLPGCETRVQLAICSPKPLNYTLFSFKVPIPLRLFSLLQFPPFIQLCLSFCLTLFLTVCLSVLMHFACGGLIFSLSVDPLVPNCTAAPDPLKVPVPWDHRILSNNLLQSYCMTIPGTSFYTVCTVCTYKYWYYNIDWQNPPYTHD